MVLPGTVLISLFYVENLSLCVRVFAGGAVRGAEVGGAGAGRQGHQYDQHTQRSAAA